MFEGIIIPVAIGIFVTVVGGLIVLYLWDGHKKKEKLKEEQTPTEPIQDKKFLTPSPERFIAFIGRANDIEKIEKKLKNDAMPILLTVGIGGIGKTELAKYFFFSHKDKFNKLAWIKYTNKIEDSFCTSFKLFEDIKDINKRYQAIIDYLSRLEGQNLLVIDDIDREDSDITKLTATLPNFKIIGTSRLRLNGFEKIDINVLKEKDAIKLFSKHYGNYDNKISESELEDLKKLLKLIANHTITIELVAKTAKIQGKSIKELLDSLREEGLGFAENVTTLAYATKDEQTTINKILSKIFDISKLDDNEISLLKQLTVLPKNFDIKISFLKQFIKTADKADLSMALHNLEQKGWIRKDIKTINIHPVIGDTLLKKLKVKFEDIVHINYFIGQNIFDQLHKNPIRAKQYIIYAEAILDVCKEEKNDKIATLLNNLSSVYQALGDLNKALKFCKKALKISEQILDKNHPYLAQSYNNLSLIYRDLGELDKALKFCKKTLNIREQILEKNHPDLATSYNNLSMIYNDLSRLDKALEYGEKANDIFEQILDKNHPHLAISYNNLSGVYQALGKLDKALEFQKKALKIREQILDKNHPDLAQSYNNLAGIYYALKDKTNALLYINKAIDIWQKIFPNGHPHLDGSKEWLEIIKKM